MINSKISNFCANKNDKTIVVSAINITEAGPLTILRDCLMCLSDNYSSNYNIVALVNKQSLFDIENITYFEFPKSKKSWLYRILYEYIYFYFFSSKLNAELWLSLHDISPNVQAKTKAVYCHNASPFYQVPFKEIILDYRFFLFTMFYRLFYKINILKNDYIIVQQDWLRSEFFKLCKHQNIIVAHPNVVKHNAVCQSEIGILKKDSRTKFIFPALPRVFKNFEIICEAVKILNGKNIWNFEVFLTISGNENAYAKQIYKK